MSNASDERGTLRYHSRDGWIETDVVLLEEFESEIDGAFFHSHFVRRQDDGDLLRVKHASDKGVEFTNVYGALSEIARNADGERLDTWHDAELSLDSGDGSAGDDAPDDGAAESESDDERTGQQTLGSFSECERGRLMTDGGTDVDDGRIEVTSWSDVDERLSPSEANAVVQHLNDTHETVLVVEDWLADEKNLHPVDGQTRVFSGRVVSETTKAWRYSTGGGETDWIPKSQSMLFVGVGEHVDSPQNQLMEYEGSGQ